MRRRVTWWWIGLVVAAAIGLAWLMLARQAGGTLDHVRREGVIRIGYAIEAPYAFLDADGRVTGESPEVARVVAARLGIPRIEWRQTEFGALLADLNAGRFDVIAAGMFITRERARDASFSEPTIHVTQGLLVQRGNPRRLTSYEAALRNPAARIAVLEGSVEAALFQRIGVPERQLVRVPDALAGRVAVESGLADGLALSAPTIQWLARQQKLGKTEAAHPFVQPTLSRSQLSGYVGFVFRKSDEDLRRAWNDQLRTFVGSVEHRQVLEQFGFTEADLPGTVSTSQILSSS